MIWVHGGELAEPLFQFCVMGLHLDQIAVFIKIYGSCFLPFGKSCFMKYLLNWGIFPGSRAGKVSVISDGKCPNDIGIV